MLWSDLQNDISSVWRIFAKISRKSEFLEPNQKIQILSKKSILRQKCTKKIRKKKFHKKCSCAIFHTDNLTRFQYQKCCEATYRTVFYLFDAFLTMLTPPHQYVRLSMYVCTVFPLKVRPIMTLYIHVY